MSKVMRLVLAASLVVAAATAWAAGVPAGKEVIKIDLIKGKKGAVDFPHAKHATEYKKGGKAIACADCHHKAKDDASVKACGSCHAAPGAAMKDKAPNLATMKGDKADTKSVIFHPTCKDGCHKEVKKGSSGAKLTSCKTCHK